MENEQHGRFHELFVRHQGQLYAYIATLLPNRHYAEEVFSEVSLVLWKKFDIFDSTREFLPWARAVAYNEVRNFRRRKHHQMVLMSDELTSLLAETREKQDEWLESRNEALKQCMLGLVPDERELIERYYGGRSSAKALAKVLRTTPAAVYMRMYRIRQFLHECIDQRLAAEKAGSHGI